MDGLIVKEPFATELVKGEKEFEYRTTPLPERKRNVKVFILNKGRILGYVIFDRDDHLFGREHKWHVMEAKQFSPYMNYLPKLGCVIWINDVEIRDPEQKTYCRCNHSEHVGKCAVAGCLCKKFIRKITTKGRIRKPKDK